MTRRLYPECTPSRLTLLLERKSLLGEMYRRENLVLEAHEYLVELGRTMTVPERVEVRR